MRSRAPSIRLRFGLAGPSCSSRSESLDFPGSGRMISSMAQKTTVSLVDDLDGESVADETVEYAIDGVTYQIDLSNDHAEALREIFAPYIAAARRTGGRARSGSGGRGRSSSSGGPVSNAAGRGREALKAIRDWAKSSGWSVSDRGRLPNNVVEAYEAAHK